MSQVPPPHEPGFVKGVASYEIRSHRAGSRGGASPFALASAAEPATAPQAEAPSNEIQDFQQLD